MCSTLIRLAAAQPQAGCRTLALTFNRCYAHSRNMTVSKSFVADQLKRHRYAILEQRRAWKQRIPAPLPRNRIWGLDLTGKMDGHGEIHSILGLVDHGTRLAMGLQPLRDKTAVTILKVLLAAIERFGKPKVIRSDNDAVFKSRLMRASLRLLGISQQFTELGCPWQNGRIERLFGTLKQKLNQIGIADFGQLQQSMLEFQWWYNHVRPHQHLHGWTPAEAWLGMDAWRTPIRSIHRVRAWGGLLGGVYLRR